MFLAAFVHLCIYNLKLICLYLHCRAKNYLILTILLKYDLFPLGGSTEQVTLLCLN